MGDFVGGIRVPELNLEDSLALATSEDDDEPRRMICLPDAQEPIPFRRQRATRSRDEQQHRNRHRRSPHSIVELATEPSGQDCVPQYRALGRAVYAQRALSADRDGPGTYMPSNAI